MRNQEEDEDDQSNSEEDANKEQLSGWEAFKQQRFKAYHPIPTVSKTITLYLLMSIVMLGCGITMILMSQEIFQYRIRYDDVCTVNTTCTLHITTQTIPAPIFVYYQLENFYQNHRLLARSMSRQQLKGQILTQSQISQDCSPIVKNSDLYVTTAIDGTPLVPTDPANPCGMMAYLIFNDTFQLSLLGSPISITTDLISWPSDSSKYAITNPSVMWYNTTDPRFMNWMRTSTLPHFRKLWGRINSNLAASTYTITIVNSKAWIMLDYDIAKFNTKKYFVVSNSNFLGSSNNYLAILYLVVGSVCFVIAMLFLVRKMQKKIKQI